MWEMERTNHNATVRAESAVEDIQVFSAHDAELITGFLGRTTYRSQSIEKRILPFSLSIPYHTFTHNPYLTTPIPHPLPSSHNHITPPSSPSPLLPILPYKQIQIHVSHELATHTQKRKEKKKTDLAQCPPSPPTTTSPISGPRRPPTTNKPTRPPHPSRPQPPLWPPRPYSAGSCPPISAGVTAGMVLWQGRE